MKQYIAERLKNFESPEQICGAAKLKAIPIVSHERIYQHIWQDKQNGRQLYKYLHHSQKKKRKRYGSKDKRGKIKNRIWMDERPKIVDNKIRIGDFELDTIVVKGHKAFLITAVERKSKLILIAKSETKQADVVANKIIDMFKPIKNIVKNLYH